MSTKFCDECRSLLMSSTTTGELVWHCIPCRKIFKSTPEDTLRKEEYTGSQSTWQMYSVFIENAPFDTAGKKVKRTCEACGLDFMTSMYIGVDETPLYVCSCGHKTTKKVEA